MFFSVLKPKEKSAITENSYQDILAEYVTGMFAYDGIPVPSYAMRYLDMILLKEGKGAIFWNDHFNAWTVGQVIFTGNGLNPYGYLPDATCFDKAGHSITFKHWESSEKCFVFFNTKSHNRDINIERYADLMSKLDISINANIVNSRMFPVVLCSDDVTASKITDVIRAGDDGATKVVSTTQNLAELLNTEPVKVLNITDVSASDKIQYLNHAQDDLLRRFLALYGININGTGKMAQQSVDEVRGSDNAALVIPYEMLESRRETLKRYSAVTGIETSVKFAKSWEREEIKADADTRKEAAEADALEASTKSADAKKNEDNGAVPADAEQEQTHEMKEAKHDISI